MKKVFTNWKMSLTALLLVGGLMLVSNSAQAQGGLLQTNPTQPDVKGAGNWALESDAINLLVGELQGNIAQALDNLPSGGQQYIVWKCKAQLYEAVLASIQNGIAVSKSVRINYDHVAGASHLDVIKFSPLSQAEWQTMFNELVDLLTS